MKTEDSFKRLWGVSFHKGKTGIRVDALERMDNMESIESYTRGQYVVRISLLGKQWHIGTTPIRRNAGLLFDSALFHLWGFAKRPQCHFNEWTEGAPAPRLFPQVSDLKMKLTRHCRKHGLELAAFDYTYAQRESV